jgi:hypothetical protein
LGIPSCALQSTAIVDVRRTHRRGSDAGTAGRHADQPG